MLTTFMQSMIIIFCKYKHSSLATSLHDVCMNLPSLFNHLYILEMHAFVTLRVYNAIS